MLLGEAFLVAARAVAVAFIAMFELRIRLCL